MKVKYLAMTAVMAALMCLAGMVLRWAPALVPFSVLPLFVYLAGIILGPRYGALSMIVYILLGLFGLPVFATAPFAGLGYILKPTFGFLLGYIFAAYVSGMIYRKGSFFSAVLSVLGGLAVIYLFGLTYLYGILNWKLHQAVNIEGVLALGFYPYIIMDLVKAGIAAFVGNQVVSRLTAAKNYSYK